MAKRKTKPRKAKVAASPAATLSNHPFAPGTRVAFLPAHVVTVERGIGREPFAKATKKGQVKRDGTLEIPASLPKGQWCAAGPVGERWCYIQFAVS